MRLVIVPFLCALAGCGMFPTVTEQIAAASDYELCYFSVAAETQYFRQSARNAIAAKGVDCNTHWPMVQARISARAADDARSMQLLQIGTQMMAPNRTPTSQALGGGAASGTAFLKRNYVSGFNRVCIYDRMGSEVAVTVGAVELCPITLP